MQTKIATANVSNLKPQKHTTSTHAEAEAEAEASQRSMIYIHSGSCKILHKLRKTDFIFQNKNFN